MRNSALPSFFLVVFFALALSACPTKFDFFGGKENTICQDQLCTWSCRSRKDCSKAEICKFERGKKTGTCVWPCTDPSRPKDENFCQWECKNDATCELERAAVVEMLEKQK